MARPTRDECLPAGRREERWGIFLAFGPCLCSRFPGDLLGVALIVFFCYHWLLDFSVGGKSQVHFTLSEASSRVESISLRA
jgi:hypothetical protein